MSAGRPPPPSSKSIEERYVEIAKKTAAAIEAERTPAAADGNGNNAIAPRIAPNLPDLPRYEPPRPTRLEPNERVCRMFFPTSGHRGFDLVKVSGELPPLEIVQQMILYETRLRLCDSIQEIMDEYHTDEAAVT